MASAEDFYAILEVIPSAPFDQIQKSYRRLALRCHPDKNKGKATAATAEFQRLARAWETLKDTVKRAEYDRVRVTLEWEEVLEKEAKEAAEKSRKRRRDVDQEATANWSRQPSPSARRFSDPFDDVNRCQKIWEWKSKTASDFASRLRSLKSSQVKLHDIVQAVQNFTLYAAKTPTASTFGFNLQAIPALRTAIKEYSPEYDLQKHILQLIRKVKTDANRLAPQTQYLKDWREKYNVLIEKTFEDDMLEYEVAESKARGTRVQEALQFLGPRDLNPPLFSMIDKRGQVINRWKALSRVKPAIAYPLDIANLEKGISEGPWHQGSNWERIGGEHPCGRCGQLAFNFLIECGPAQCQTCDIIVCHTCHRDLIILGEYDRWIQAPEGSMTTSLFSLDIEKDPVLPDRTSSGTWCGYEFGSARI